MVVEGYVGRLDMRQAVGQLVPLGQDVLAYLKYSNWPSAPIVIPKSSHPSLACYCACTLGIRCPFAWDHRGGRRLGKIVHDWLDQGG